MGKEKYVREVLEFLKKTPVASFRDIKVIVDRSRPKTAYSHLLVHNLVRSDRIRRVVRGFYTLGEEPTVAVFCFKPAYLGLQDALSIHGVWEQEGNVVIVTSGKARPGLRRVMESGVVLRRIKPRYMFGFDYTKSGESFFPVSDLEKTLIDFFYFREPIDKEVLRKLKRKINRKKLKAYLNRYPKKFRERFKNI